MDKPLSIIIEDTKKDLISVINKSNLPICIIEMIFKNLMSDINILSINELEKDKQNYSNESEEDNERSN